MLAYWQLCVTFLLWTPEICSYCYILLSSKSCIDDVIANQRIVIMLVSLKPIVINNV